MQSIKVHELAPPTCVLLLSKNFDPCQLLNVAPPLSIVHVQNNFSLMPLAYFISLYDLSPFVISFHKRCASLDIKGCIWVDGWHLNLAFFMDTSKYWNDTTCIALEIPRIGSSTLIPIDGTLPLCHSMGHPLDKLELLYVRDAFFIWWSLKVENHLWNHRLVWLIPRVEMWYHLEEFSSMEPLVGFVHKKHFLNICYHHEYHLWDITCELV